MVTTRSVAKSAGVTAWIIEFIASRFKFDVLRPHATDGRVGSDAERCERAHGQECQPLRGPKSLAMLDTVTSHPTTRAMVLALLDARAAGATVCPSEVARAIATAAGKADWREEMPAVHLAVEEMVADGSIRLTWQGVDRAVKEGPYRINRAQSSLDINGA